MVGKNLFKKSILYFIGNLSSKVLSVLLIPIYAYFVTSDDLGYFDFSQTIMGIISPIIILAIWEAILKFILSEDDIRVKQKVITTSTIFSIVMSIIFTIFTFIFFTIYDHQLEYLSMVIAMIVIHSLVYVWQYYARAYEKNKLFVVSGIISTIVNFLFVILLVVLLNMGFLGLVIAYNVGQISIILIIERRLSILKNIKLKDFDCNLMKRMLQFSSPLVLNLISSWLISGFGRFIITIKLGTGENGIYSFANRFSLLITMIGTVVTMAIIEEAILSVKKNGIDKDFNKALEGLFKIFQYISLLAVPAIVIFYEFISNTVYYSSLVYAPWLLIFAVMITMASNIGSIFQAINKTKYQFFTTLAGALVTVIISLILINELGLMGVIIGQILGASTMMFSRYILVNKFVTVKINWIPIFFRMAIFILTVVICLNTHIYTNIIIEFLLIIIISVTNRDLLTNSVQAVKEKIRKE